MHSAGLCAGSPGPGLVTPNHHNYFDHGAEITYRVFEVTKVAGGLFVGVAVGSNRHRAEISLRHGSLMLRVSAGRKFALPLGL
jgi:hypothetical protein